MCRWPRSQIYSLRPLCSVALCREERAGTGASYHLPMGTGIAPCKHMKDFWIKGLRFQDFTSGSFKIFLHGSGYVVWPLSFQICKTGKNNLRKSAGKLNSFIVIKKTEICREKPHRIFLLPHIQELIFSLLGQSEPLLSFIAQQNRAKHKRVHFTPEIRISKRYFIHLRSC